MHSMSLPKTEIYTTDYIYALPEEQRAELIDGKIYDMAPPNRKHQRITGNLYRKIRNYIEEHNGSYKVNIALFAVFLNTDDYGCIGAPDWIIEVVSPSSKRIDYHIKLFKYRTAGVREYWIVDPMRDTIMVYNFSEIK